MSFLVKLGLILSLFTSWSSCFTKFIRPPEWNPDQKADRDMSKNNHYADGDTIPILFETSIKEVDLYVWQVIGGGGKTRSLMQSRGTFSLLFIILLIKPLRQWPIE